MNTYPKEPKPQIQKKQKQKGVMSQQIKKMWKIKRSNYFMFYWYLKLNPQGTIIINSNFRNMKNTEFFFPNFACDCILINGKCIYEMGTYFKTCYDEEKKMYTVYFNPKTGLPLKDRSYTSKDLTETERRVLLQHVLFHELEKFGESCGVKFFLKTLKGRKTKKLSILNIGQMTFQMDDGIVELSGKQFQDYLDSIGIKVNEYFSSLLNKNSNITDILVLGYNHTNSNIRENDKYMQILAGDFISSIDQQLQQDSPGLIQIPSLVWNLKAYNEQELKHFLEIGIINTQQYECAIHSRNEMIRLKLSSNIAQPNFFLQNIANFECGQIECVEQKDVVETDQILKEPENSNPNEENDNFEFQVTPMEQQEEMDGFHHNY